MTVVLQPSPGYHEGFTLKSRRFHWNSEHAVYELDFGGRINHDSVKNFQLEHNREVVSDTEAPSVGKAGENETIHDCNSDITL